MISNPVFLFGSVLRCNAGSNGHVTYGGVTEEGFIINPVTGVITTTKELDTERQDHYMLTGTIKLLNIPHLLSQIITKCLNNFHLLSVYARDRGLPPNFAKAVVRVEVQDVNDNAPVFAKPWYGLEVPENQAPVELCFLKATDPDSGPGGELEYRITGEKEFHVSDQRDLLEWC